MTKQPKPKKDKVLHCRMDADTLNRIRAFNEIQYMNCTSDSQVIALAIKFFSDSARENNYNPLF